MKDIKIKPTQLACLTLSALILLASCGQKTEPSQPDAPAESKLEGTISSGSGSGKVTLKVADKTFSGDIASNGKFSLVLPNSSDLSDELVDVSQVLKAIGCEGTLTSSATDAKGYSFAQLQSKREGITASVFSATTKRYSTMTFPIQLELKATALLYASKASNVSGKATCQRLMLPKDFPMLLPNQQFGIGGVVVNLKLRPGWNYVAINITSQMSADFKFSGTGSATVVDSYTTPWKSLQDITKNLVSE